MCEACANATDRPNAIIDHPPSEEIPWIGSICPSPPTSWGWTRWRTCSLAPAPSGLARNLGAAMTQPHLGARAREEVWSGFAGRAAQFPACSAARGSSVTKLGRQSAHVNLAAVPHDIAVSTESEYTKSVRSAHRLAL